MKVTKEILDRKVKDFEDDCDHDLTFREYIIELEEELGLEHLNLDKMTDEELNEYDCWLWEVSWK